MRLSGTFPPSSLTDLPNANPHQSRTEPATCRQGEKGEDQVPYFVIALPERVLRRDHLSALPTSVCLLHTCFSFRSHAIGDCNASEDGSISAGFHIISAYL